MNGPLQAYLIPLIPQIPNYIMLAWILMAPWDSNFIFKMEII